MSASRIAERNPARFAAHESKQVTRDFPTPPFPETTPTTFFTDEFLCSVSFSDFFSQPSPQLEQLPPQAIFFS
jgi:hypothetical protein